MKPINISQQTARRFVLGKQGLWPGRRWKGKAGAAEAIRACEAVQLDPLTMIARSQDIVLHSRVINYQPQYLYQAAYADREFFDYGGWLAMYPMADLPYWRFHQERRLQNEYVKYFVPEHQKVLEQVRAELRKNGPMGNRDFDGQRLKTHSYRGRKETAVALFDMWLCGELMIHHREGFERFYDFREKIAPKKYDYVATEKEAIEFFARKAVSFVGLKREGSMKAEWQYSIQRDFSKAEVENLLGAWKESGRFAQVQVEGGRDVYLVLAEDLSALESLEKGRVPKGWNPKETNTLEEMTFLSPLDIVSARGRAKKLFDFEYIWEVYTPAPKRRWGYYVLPVLYGDDLVARFDSKFDRATQTFQILGFWLEKDTTLDSAFAEAFANGLTRFAKMLNAKKVDVSGIKQSKLRTHLKQKLKVAS
ncbi:MAG: YcaQ family DNA glycosylase [Anaerolineales bacterium]|nr:YcaQ family DNA glycosylase [Anaerolineales bacterium]